MATLIEPNADLDVPDKLEILTILIPALDGIVTTFKDIPFPDPQRVIVWNETIDKSLRVSFATRNDDGTFKWTANLPDLSPNSRIERALKGGFAAIFLQTIGNAESVARVEIKTRFDNV